MSPAGKLLGLITLILALAAPARAGACDHPYVPLSQNQSGTFVFKSKADGKTSSTPSAWTS